GFVLPNLHRVRFAKNAGADSPDQCFGFVLPNPRWVRSAKCRGCSPDEPARSIIFDAGSRAPATSGITVPHGESAPDVAIARERARSGSSGLRAQRLWPAVRRTRVAAYSYSRCQTAQFLRSRAALSARGFVSCLSVSLGEPRAMERHEAQRPP